MVKPTAEHSLEEQVKRLEQRLAKAEAELQEFVYIASHDLQEPLRKINSFGQRLQDLNSDTLDERSMDYLQRMLGASDRMQEMLQGLLAFSRVATVTKPFERVELELLVQKIANQFQKKTDSGQARIVVDKLPAVDCDTAQIQQLFSSLFDNAIKFKHENVQPIVVVSAQEDAENPNRIIIQIKDNGMGFKAEKKEQIFQLFQKLNGRQFSGAGMGLAIARRIAERHGGSLVADSQPALGASFTLTLLRDYQPESGEQL